MLKVYAQPYCGDPEDIMQYLGDFDFGLSDPGNKREKMKKLVNGGLVLESLKDLDLDGLRALSSEELEGLIDCVAIEQDRFRLKFAWVMHEPMDDFLPDKFFKYDREFFENIYYHFREQSLLAKVLFSKQVTKFSKERKEMIAVLLSAFTQDFYGPTEFTDAFIKLIMNLDFDFVDELSFLEKNLPGRIYEFLKSATVIEAFKSYIEMNLTKEDYEEFLGSRALDDKIVLFDAFYKALTEFFLYNIRLIFPLFDKIN